MSIKKISTINDSLTAEQVLTHVQNNSTAKQQFSFPKAQRFNCKTQLSQYTFYALPSTKTKLSAFICNQRRVLFGQNNDLPSPDKYSYSIDGQFSSSSKKVKGCYMGLGRSDIKINNFLGSPNDGPGPLRYYNPENSSGLEKRQYSFNKQQKFISLRKFDQQSVGPGSYKIDSSLDEQKQILSTQYRSLCPKIQETKIEIRKKRLITEPSMYCPMVTAKGNALKFDSNRGVKIGMGKRSTLSKHDSIPGPGQYKMFSEFLSKGKS